MRRDENFREYLIEFSHLGIFLTGNRGEITGWHYSPNDDTRETSETTAKWRFDAAPSTILIVLPL